MGDKLPPAMEKSTPPIRSEEKQQLFAATKAEMEKEKGDTIKVKRKMDISAEKESGRKRKKKVKHRCSDNIKEEDNTEKEKKKEKKERKRPRNDEDPIKTEEAGSEQKRPHQEEEVPLPVAVSMCQVHALLGIGSFGKVPSVDFGKTIEEPESIKYKMSSEYLTPSSQLEDPSHCWTSSNLCHSQAQPMAINYPYHPSPFGPFGFSVQPYTAYWPHVGFYQQPFPSVPYNLHPFLGPVIRPPPVSVLVPVYHNLPLDVVNTPWPFPSHLQ
ncbi:uncharacterized protein LOC108705455 isoform X2 [Xenopus laevis]|uniref:Uncharacterized protein LOC108705455 isoform X2 n=1 Tax=Xenopus laevis TaxID=8355 RepID=A0A8J1KL43_XENLA|nr:uncharacterized protein LOC108705455 isoform X2 [Xenopus laevis]